MEANRLAATPDTSRYMQSFLPLMYLCVRYYAAFTLLTYGFAKNMGAQFTVLDSQLAKPMGDVSGFWLTWYYFGYSPIYSNFVAIVQIVGAILLCFRRTSLIGALALLPVMLNIVCIDLWVIGWHFDNSALRNAVYVLAALCFVICLHAKDLFSFFRQAGEKFALLSKSPIWIIGIQIAIVLAMVAYKAHEGYWLANVNNRAPTPIDGAWHVTDMQPMIELGPDWIYFEYNRAFMAVFHFPDGHTETHDFRVDPVQKSLTISKEWLTPGSDIFKGKWVRDGDILKLTGTWHNGMPVEMTLQRKPMPVKDHS